MQGLTWKGEGGRAKPLIMGEPSPPIWFGFPAVAVSPLTCCIIHSKDRLSSFDTTDTRKSKKDKQLLLCPMRTSQIWDEISMCFHLYHLVEPQIHPIK